MRNKKQNGQIFHVLCFFPSIMPLGGRGYWSATLIILDRYATFYSFLRINTTHTLNTNDDISIE